MKRNIHNKSELDPTAKKNKRHYYNQTKIKKKIEKLTYDVELKSLLRAGHLNTRRRPKPELGRAQTIATYGPAQIDDRNRAK